jgi:hypothetical protein
MKAKPVILKYGEGYFACTVEEATHVTLNIPGPVGNLTLPVIRSGTRAGTPCWSWNGSVDKPTLKPSVLTTMTQPNGTVRMRCHSWVNDGQIQFLSDATHEFANQTVDLLDVD